MNYEDQGFGVKLAFEEIAKEFLRQEGKPINTKNLHSTIQRLAKENAESYTPNNELGQNPSSRIAMSQLIIMAPLLYGSNSLLAQRISDKKILKDTQTEILGAVTHLTQIIMKRMYGFKIKNPREPAANTSNPNEITDFEYLASGPGNNLNKEQREVYNKHVDINRHIKILIQTYIFWAISPLLIETRKSINDIMINLGYKQIARSVFTKPANVREFIFMLNKSFAFIFTQITLKGFFGGRRWTAKGKFIKGKVAKKP